ncbi:TIGR00153 family protein [Spongiibacter taiwanensis]|uniref:TIGR00153 family protein n=1 Tax=Spongiibacter taiwanensis TaxID=1748242 RepID=UPI002034C638|nr:TIGR00153 family protein [Spongiibacter taiwanensis]USA41607.1 TIGR00153 family protein [Spongiibacter taiwanensis]
MPLNKLNNLFGKSPFGPVQDHMKLAHQAAERLGDFFDAVLANNWADAQQHQQAISKLEKEADRIKKSLRLSLPNSLFLPVPRTDLLELLRMQDRIANRAEDVAGLMIGRQMKIPAEIAEKIRDFVTKVIATSKQAHTAIEELDELLETGFNGPEASFVEKLIEELDSLEQHTDTCQVEVRTALFAIEQDIPPVDAMFLYQVVGMIGEIADGAQKVGSRLEIVIAR